MISSLNSNGYGSLSNGFMIGNNSRVNTVVSLDPDVRELLDELDQLLERKINLDDTGPKASRRKRKKDEEESGVVDTYFTPEGALRGLLMLPLVAKRIGDGEEPWADSSFVNFFYSLEEDDEEAGMSLNDLIGSTPELSELYYEFQSAIQRKFLDLPINYRAIFQQSNKSFAYRGIASYLVSYAYFVMQIRRVDALMSFLEQNENGVQNVVRFLTVSTARTLIYSEKFDVDNLNDDEGPLADFIKGLKVSFQRGAFKMKVLNSVKKFIFSNPYYGWINKWIEENGGADSITEDLKDKILHRLISLDKSKTVRITEANSGTYISAIFTQLNSEANYAENATYDGYEADSTSGDEDFTVDFFVEDGEDAQVNVSNVRCAAQLFYSMTLGDELDVFNVVNYFTHKYLVRGGMEIKDRRLREDLQMYVFSNKFIDLRTGREMDRTRPAERQMFYKQVFNFGTTKVTEDLIVNDEFSRLWKVLIVESARYLERAQESPNPINFVSRQNVVQAVEDIQYNLSTHCTGMVNVITPIIYQELRFVINRIFKNKEVMNQVVPSGGSWWRVVENLYASMRSKRMKTTVINSKAEYGHDIIKAIAEYNRSSFQNDDSFSAFITNVDSFITTQSILQDSVTDQIKKIDNNGVDDSGREEMQPKKISGAAPIPAPAGGGDEWDF